MRDRRVGGDGFVAGVHGEERRRGTADHSAQDERGIREVAGQEILIPPNSPSPGVTVAFIVHDGAPVEFLQFDRKKI